ncbi:hypothetical protein I307_00473 [Cryptococcus deuterogattii 99/473]|uniref:Mitochondrial inner membrane protein 1 n=2 Tax=Cryptococcus deuterogattii TaxID=1859096 RepID=A0A0D0V5D1_9TREE|nr:hypothetical protein CNBG_2200 [Cryptococcus deuterogattii R265]KIR27517.1 hypothetical protein I309_03438 [Cryptococcus deuterogattii LA55]KIR33398.1 hypothetical protein I352_04167 [Cryptococcus deuterogattii MMRL2647]KIR41859.1 hypothetical protein I313_02019 [Cryptococcus deuterogattii Ram5]KIR73316.1 hypothetical protein I310_02982 [Cryptococcus deuterogattii CA1014]KIR91651.1 hypothetical protein I304_04475 [Cryptococcus deuterogattii CBS 10090]KIR99072.1 hypothetical protein L804_03
MNRSLRILRPQTYALPYRPRPAGLPSNLLRPVAPTSSPVGAKVSQYLTFMRTYASGPGSSAENDKKYVEKQKATPGAKEELKGLTTDFAKIVAGSSKEAAQLGAREQSTTRAHPGSITEDFGSITSAMWTAVPKPAMYFGLAGTLPYLATSLGTVLLARQASITSTSGSEAELVNILQNLHLVEHVQITYGAVLLSFLGAIHWGMEFAKLGGEKGALRLALGAAPVLFAWPTTFLSHGVALAAQWCGFTALWAADQRASSAGWTTGWYSTYRFYLSLVVGFSIIGTLAGTGFYGAGAGANFDPDTKHFEHTTRRVSPLARFDRVKEMKESSKGRIEGKVKGDISVVEDNESFLKLKNVQKEEDQKKEEEEEQKNKAAEQDKKESAQKDKSPGGMKDDQKQRTEGGDKKDQGKQDGDQHEKKDQGGKKDSKQAEKEDQDAKKKKAHEEKGAAGNPNAGMR